MLWLCLLLPVRNESVCSPLERIYRKVVPLGSGAMLKRPASQRANERATHWTSMSGSLKTITTCSGISRPAGSIWPMKQFVSRQTNSINKSHIRFLPFQTWPGKNNHLRLGQNQHGRNQKASCSTSSDFSGVAQLPAASSLCRASVN